MADAIPTVIGAACMCFGTEAGHAINIDDRRRKLSDEVDKLKNQRKDVQKVVDNAAAANREPTEVAKGWMKRADNAIRDAETAIEKAEQKMREYSEELAGGGRGRCGQGWSRYKLGKRLAKVTKEVVRREEESKDLKIFHDYELVNPAATKEKTTQDAAADGEKKAAAPPSKEKTTHDAATDGEKKSAAPPPPE